MIAIKGMDMPKSCMKCKFTNSLHEIHYCLFNREPITDYGWQKKRPDFCPLTELPEENKDMSWEELVEKTKNKISGELREGRGIYIDIGLVSFRFLKCGDVIFEYTVIKTAQTPYQMYQIIKALGDQK